MTLAWPDVLQPDGVSADLLPRPIMGPPAMSGGQQTVQSDAGCWQIRYSGIHIVGAFRVKAYRMISAQMNGPSTPILLPVFDCKRAPWPLDANGRAITSYGSIPHSDGSFFSDGSGYSQRVIDILSSSTAVRGDIELDITILNASVPDPGEFFSVGERLYVLTSVEFLSGSEYRIGFMPPLRESIADGTQLEFEHPVCRCVMSDTSGMPLMLSQRLFGRPDLNFIEDFS